MGDARPGAPLPLVLYWQAEAPVAQSYTVFTQLLNAQGVVVAQQDNPPVAGQEPTETWTPDTLVRDPYTLNLPADLPAGAYTLLVGMYDAQGQRAPLIQDAAAAGDAFVIEVNVK